MTWIINLITGWRAIAGATLDTIVKVMAGIWESLVALLGNLVHWFFSPADFFNTAIWIIAKVCVTVSEFFPESISPTIRTMGNWLWETDMEPFFQLALYLISPFIEPAVAQALLSITMLVWIMAIGVRVCIWLYGKLPTLSD